MIGLMPDIPSFARWVTLAHLVESRDRCNTRVSPAAALQLSPLLWGRPRPLHSGRISLAPPRRMSLSSPSSRYPYNIRGGRLQLLFFLRYHHMRTTPVYRSFDLSPSSIHIPPISSFCSLFLLMSFLASFFFSARRFRQTATSTSCDPLV